MPERKYPTAVSSDGITRYQQEIRRYPLLSAREERELTCRMRDGDHRCRDLMIERNLRLVLSVARRYQNRGVPLMDLVSEGNIGLMRAVEKFDPERGFRFSTYATRWISQAVERCVMNHARTVRLPIHVIKEISQCLRARGRLQDRLRRPVTARDIAAETGKSLEQVIRLMGLHEAGSRDSQAVADPAPPMDPDTIPDNLHAEEPESRVVDEDLRQRVQSWLGSLNKKQQDVLIRRFGFYEHRADTLEEVGRHIGLTRERVRQIQIEALEYLREENGAGAGSAC